MTKKQNPHINIFELPFIIYIAIVDNRQGLSEDETEKFIQTISASDWPESNILQTILKNANNEYSHSWKKYLSGEFTSPLQSLQNIHEYILLDLDEAEKEVYINDMLHLVECLFNASNSLFLASSESKLKIHELIKSILLETTVKTNTACRESLSGGEESSTEYKKSSTVNQDSRSTKISPHLTQLWPLAEINENNAVFWKRGKIDLRCIQIIDETHDVKTFRFVSSEKGQLFFFKPGQFIGIELTISGKKIIRSYTISSTPSRPHNLSITVKRVPGGHVSNWLHDNMKVGDIISANGPNGQFNCFDYPAKKMLLISGGSGITPVMSMLRWIADTSSDADIVFLHNSRTPHDVIYAKELDLLSSMHSNIKVVIAVSDKAYDGWQGFTGRISPQMIEMIAPDFLQRSAYVCGPGEYMDTVHDILEWMKFPMENYYSESFGGAPKKRKTTPLYNDVKYTPTEQDVSQFSLSKSESVTATQNAHSSINKSNSDVANNDNAIFFQQSSKHAPHDCSSYILDIAEDADVDIPSSCLQGSCGTCKVLKIEGEVIMEATQDVLSDDEINEGYILACCSIPKGKVVIDA